jgi:hypothetical protein
MFGKCFIFNRKMAQKGKIAQGNQSEAWSHPAQSIKPVTFCVICTGTGAFRRAHWQSLCEKRQSLLFFFASFAAFTLRSSRLEAFDFRSQEEP